MGIMKKEKSELQFFLTRLKQRFTSEILWHFVGRGKTDEQSFRSLTSILKSGLHRGEHSDDFKFIHPKTKKHETWPGHRICSLADIPLKDLHIHVERYGGYALGFHKKNAVLEGFHPVLYASRYSDLFARFVEARDEVSRAVKNTGSVAKKCEELLRVIGSLCKSGDVLAEPKSSSRKDTKQINNFYYEREWRSVRDWDFKPADVALLILPDKQVGRFFRERKKHKFRLQESTPILPLKLMYQL